MLAKHRLSHCWGAQSTRSVAVAACAMLVGLPACAPPVTQPPKSDERVFSDDDRRAALALSLSRSGAVAAQTNPYEQAVQCSLAIKFIVNRFGTAAIGNPEVIEALEKAQRIYADRAAASRSAQEDVSAEDNGDARPGEAIQDPADRARVALACLQDLA